MIGSVWQGTTRDHKWKVRVLTTNTTTVTFTILHGGGAMRGGRRRCLPKTAFLRAYRQVK